MTTKQTACHFHPNTPSQFHCNRCDTNYCPDCVTWRQSREFFDRCHFMCPRCNVEMEIGGVGHLVEPFWRRLPEFFKYPFSREPLIFIFGFGIISGVTALVPFLYIPMYTICLFLLLQYCNLVFKRTINGIFTQPSAGDISFDDEFELIGKQVLLFFLLKMIGFHLVNTLGLSWGLLLGEVGKLLLPAMFILLLVNSSLRSALNPLYIFVFLKRIGWRYLLLYCFTSLLMSASESMYYLLDSIGFPDWLNQPIYHVCESYYFIVMFQMMGYVVLQYHVELGHEIDYTKYLQSNFGDQFQRNRSMDPILNDAHLMLAESKPGEALEMIRRETQGEFVNPDLALLYVKLLKLQGESSKLKFTGSGILELLVEEKRLTEADALYRQCLAEVPGFSASSVSLLGLHRFYVEKEDYLQGFKCGILFAEKLPQDHRSPSLLLIAAGIALKHLDDRQCAMSLYEKFLQKYPEHDKAAVTKKRLNSLRISSPSSVKS